MQGVEPRLNRLLLATDYLPMQLSPYVLPTDAIRAARRQSIGKNVPFRPQCKLCESVSAPKTVSTIAAMMMSLIAVRQKITIPQMIARRISLVDSGSGGGAWPMNISSLLTGC